MTMFSLLRRIPVRWTFYCTKSATKLIQIMFLVSFISLLLTIFHSPTYTDFVKSFMSPFLKSNQLGKYEGRKANRSQNLKKILFWNDFFGMADYKFGEGQQPFIDSNCPINTCITTSDRKMFAAEELDALVWHANSFDQSFPSERYAHTRYVFFQRESPKNAIFAISSLDGIFNYTMTYRNDSDVHFPYGYFVRRGSSLPSPKRNYAAGKTKMAAWVVSHCFSSSQRENLVDTLQEFIPVDIYGSCGPLECGSPDRETCYRTTVSKYKFYLALENSFCQDYSTEKFYYPSKHDIVPVVYGLEDYKKIAPPKSYINVMDFKNVKELAEYLIYLDKNDTAYNEYFDWKSSYEAVPVSGEPWCELCSKLHSDQEPKVYSDLKGWYETDKCKEVDQNIQENWFWSQKSMAKRLANLVYFKTKKISNSLLFSL